MKTALVSLILALAATGLLAGCADNAAIITGQVRPAITPDRVRVYFQPPAGKYDTIGIVTGSSKNKFGASRQGKTDAALRSIKEKAAEIGANGVIVQSQGMSSGGTVGVVSGGVFIASSSNNMEVQGTAHRRPIASAPADAGEAPSDERLARPHRCRGARRDGGRNRGDLLSAGEY